MSRGAIIIVVAVGVVALAVVAFVLWGPPGILGVLLAGSGVGAAANAVATGRREQAAAQAREATQTAQSVGRAIERLGVEAQADVTEIDRTTGERRASPTEADAERLEERFRRKP